MLRFLCKKCGKRMKVTDDDVGRKIRCPSCAYATAVPPIKLNAKTYHFEYSVCDSINASSSPGKNALEPAGASLGGVTLPPSGRNLLAQEPAAPPPSHTLPLRPGAKLAPSPKDPARYQAAISRSRARTAALRLRPAAIPMPVPAPVVAQEAIPAPRPVTQEPESLTLAPPMSKPPQPQARVQIPAPPLAPPAKAPAPPAPVVKAPPRPAALAVGPIAPSPTDSLRYEAALQRSRAITAGMRQASAPVSSPEIPVASAPLEQTPEPQTASEEPVIQRPLEPPRPESPPVVSDRPEAPPIRRPDAPVPIKRPAAAHVPRAGMPRPIIIKESAAESSFVETPDTTPLPVSGRVDPAAQALEQMSRQTPQSPVAASASAVHDATSGYSNTHDPAEALRQLAMAAAAQQSAPAPIVEIGQDLGPLLGQDDADADALTGLARHVPSAPRKLPTPPKPIVSKPAPAPSDQERYNAALAASRDKTRQATGK